MCVCVCVRLLPGTAHSAGYRSGRCAGVPGTKLVKRFDAVAVLSAFHFDPLASGEGPPPPALVLNTPKTANNLFLSHNVTLEVRRSCTKNSSYFRPMLTVFGVLLLKASHCVVSGSHRVLTVAFRATWVSYNPQSTGYIYYRLQWRTQEFCSGGGSTNSVEDRGQSERGSGGGSPLVRGSAVAYPGILFGGSTNSVEDRENEDLGAVAP